MHPRISVSAICTDDWPLERDLAFYRDAGITNVGVSVAKLEQHGWALEAALSPVLTEAAARATGAASTSS